MDNRENTGNAGAQKDKGQELNQLDIIRGYFGIQTAPKKEKGFSRRGLIFPMIFEILLLLPYIKGLNGILYWGTETGTRIFFWYGMQFAVVLVTILARRAEYLHFFIAQGAALAVLLILILAEKLPLVDITVFDGYDKFGHFAELLVLSLNFVSQLAGGAAAEIVGSIAGAIKRKRHPVSGSSETRRQDKKAEGEDPYDGFP
ncbi:MAG: hypothetical protein IKO27_00035 [Ruminococcus sp.]|nr:hypothetical protein [Ruminococcus sp.]